MVSFTTVATLLEILTTFQTAFLKEIAETPLNRTFFLTGGTALSAFYLQHRLSEDLDFFTEEPGQIPQVLTILHHLAPKLAARVEVRRQFASFLEVFVHSNDGEILKCDFAQDSPFRHHVTVHDAATGIFVDNALDIACNKLSALFDRLGNKGFLLMCTSSIRNFSHSTIFFRRRGRNTPVLTTIGWQSALQKIQELTTLPAW